MDINFNPIYTVPELEVRISKRLEMIEKQNNFCISYIHLQEYKKGFAFLTKFHNFSCRGGLSEALKMWLSIFSQTIRLEPNFIF